MYCLIFNGYKHEKSVFILVWGKIPLLKKKVEYIRERIVTIPESEDGK